MHMPVVTRLTALCVAGAALAASANASAHYYAEVSANTSNADDGAFVELWTNTLHSTCNFFQHDFVNHEFWYTSATDGGSWVEIGFKDGDSGSQGRGCVTQNVFWEEVRDGFSNEHVTSWGLQTGTWIPFQISSAGNCTWSVIWAGQSIGTSATICLGSGRVLKAGIETTSQTTGSVKGWQSDWWEQNGGGSWIHLWDGAALCQSDGSSCTSGSPQIQWRWPNNTGAEEVLNEGW